MKKVLFAFLMLFTGVWTFAQIPGREQRLKEHVYFFASDSLRGRPAGSGEARKAAAYIVDQFQEIGLRPYLEDGRWLQRFSTNGGNFHNVLAIIDGSDPGLKNQYVVVGAHFDHIGVKKGEICNGADDNASGTAALIEIARELYKNRDKLKRSVIIAAFDAEELGLYGSNHLAKTLCDSVGVKNIKMMMSIDMVGWYAKSGHLEMQGTGTLENGAQFVSNIASADDIKVKTIRFEMSPIGSTDTQGFAERKIPTLYATTGLKSPYHKPEDDADLIDYRGLDKVAGYLTDVIEKSATSTDFYASGKISPKHYAKAARVEAGIRGGLGSSSMTFPGGAFNSKTAFTWEVGAGAQVNFAHDYLAARADILYGSYSSKFPGEYDIYNTTRTYRQNALMVPLSFVVQSQGPVRFHVLGGPYYSHVFSAYMDGKEPEWGLNKNQWGGHWGFGMTAFHVRMSLDFRYSGTPAFSGADAPTAKIRNTVFSIA